MNLTAVWLTERGEPRGGDRRVTLCRTHDCCGALRFARLRRRGRRRMVYALEAGCGQTTTKAERLAAASTLVIVAGIPFHLHSIGQLAWRSERASCECGSRFGLAWTRRGWLLWRSWAGRPAWVASRFSRFGDEFGVVTWCGTDTNQRI